MFKCRRKLLVLLTAALIALFMTASAGAVETITGDTIVVPEGKIYGPLFAAGNEVVINAEVDGDVFAAGQTVTINGSVNGDVLAAANIIRINGNVSGDARCASSDLDIRGQVGRSLTSAAANIRLLEGSRINQDALFFAGSATLSGALGRQALGHGGTVRLNGPVGGDVRLWSVSKDLSVGPAAEISGNLTYGSPREASIAPGAKIAGTTRWDRQEPPKTEKPNKGISWLAQLAWFAAGILVWIVFTLLFPRLWARLGGIIIETPLPALGWGFLLLVAAPLAALLLLITVIGIPISLTMIMAYSVLLYAGKIIIGDAVGRLMARRFGWNGRVHEILPFMTAFAGLILLSKIPVAGFLINLVVASMAIGAVFLAFLRWRRLSGAPPAVECFQDE